MNIVYKKIKKTIKCYLTFIENIYDFVNGWKYTLHI